MSDGEIVGNTEGTGCVGKSARLRYRCKALYDAEVVEHRVLV